MPPGRWAFRLAFIRSFAFALTTSSASFGIAALPRSRRETALEMACRLRAHAQNAQGSSLPHLTCHLDQPQECLQRHTSDVSDMSGGKSRAGAFGSRGSLPTRRCWAQTRPAEPRVPSPVEHRVHLPWPGLLSILAGKKAPEAQATRPCLKRLTGEALHAMLSALLAAPP